MERQALTGCSDVFYAATNDDIFTVGIWEAANGGEPGRLSSDILAGGLHEGQEPIVVRGVVLHEENGFSTVNSKQTQVNTYGTQVCLARAAFGVAFLLFSLESIKNLTSMVLLCLTLLCLFHGVLR